MNVYLLFEEDGENGRLLDVFASKAAAMELVIVGVESFNRLDAGWCKETKGWHEDSFGNSSIQIYNVEPARPKVYAGGYQIIEKEVRET